MRLNHDLHVHTYLSACCHDRQGQTPAAILARAEEMGVATIGFADHVWMNPDVEPNDWYRPQDARQIEQLREDLRHVSTTTRILVGCEADTAAPGRFSITPEFAAQLDFVLLSCSHFHIENLVAQPRSHDPRDVAEHLLTFFRSAVSSGLATSIPHPFMPLGYMEQFDATIAAISDAEFLEVFAVAREHGVALEVTTGFLPNPSRGVPTLDTPTRFLSLARQAGCRFTLGTDAHEPAAQRRLPELQIVLEAAGITDEDMLMRDRP